MDETLPDAMALVGGFLVQSSFSASVTGIPWIPSVMPMGNLAFQKPGTRKYILTKGLM